MTRKSNTLLGSPTDIPENAPREVVGVEFARRLQKAMDEKGWNQSELARAATTQMVNGRITRDQVSKWINGHSLPGSARLDAVAKAVGMTKDDLLPTRGISPAQGKMPPMDLRDLGDGQVWLRINQAVSWETSIKIMELLKASEQERR